MKTKTKKFSSVKQLLSALKPALKKGDIVLFDQTLFTCFAEDCAKLRGNVLLFPGGEDCKRWAELGKLLAILSSQSIERDKTLYVVGGGAICDLGAFTAAIYRRGMRLVLVPTTLLSQADAAFGGKTAVDLTVEGRLLKNAAGVFYPAAELWLCTGWLETLPKRERLSGVAEILKMQWLNGVRPNIRGWAEWCEGRADLPKSLERCLQNALRWKAEVVAKDFYDTKDIRAQLNFGHTLGHAMESIAQGRLSHGAAVAWGMWAECEFFKSPVAAEIFFVLQELGYEFPRFLAKTPVTEWTRLLKGDKKMKSGKVVVPALPHMGRVSIRAVAPQKLAGFAAKLLATTAVL